MFALRSPLAKGVILADEVGLEKTIEAGLVLCQFWAERRRRLLVVCPARHSQAVGLELEEKFSLPTLIPDASTYMKQSFVSDLKYGVVQAAEATPSWRPSRHDPGKKSGTFPG